MREWHKIMIAYGELKNICGKRWPQAARLEYEASHVGGENATTTALFESRPEGIGIELLRGAEVLEDAFGEGAELVVGVAASGLFEKGLDRLAPPFAEGQEGRIGVIVVAQRRVGKALEVFVELESSDDTECIPSDVAAAVLDRIFEVIAPPRIAEFNESAGRLEPKQGVDEPAIE